MIYVTVMVEQSRNLYQQPNKWHGNVETAVEWKDVSRLRESWAPDNER